MGRLKSRTFTNITGSHLQASGFAAPTPHPAPHPWRLTLRWSRFVGVVMASLLAGCGGPLFYVVPTGDLGGYTKVTITNRSKLGMDHHLYEDSFTCTSRVFFSRGIDLLPTDGTRTVYLKRGEAATIWSAWAIRQGTFLNPTQMQCTLIPTFSATAEAYEVVFDSLDDATRCRVAVFEGDAAGGRRVPPEQVILRSPGRRAPYRDGPWCKALTPEQLDALGLKPPPEKPVAVE